jgi:cytochrome P450
MAVPHGPPRPRERVPGAFFWRLRGNPLQAMVDLRREVGPVGFFSFAGRRVYVVSEPELLHDIFVTHDRDFVKGKALERSKRMLGNGLLTSEGELHRRQRRLVQPAFHKRRIAAYAACMVRQATELGQAWRDGSEVEVLAAMNTLALTIVAETLFGSSVADETDAVREALDETMRSFRLVALPFTELLDDLPLPSVLRFRRARARLDATIYRLIDEHRRGLGRADDLLTMLLEARDEDAEHGAASTGLGMTDLQVRDEALTIFLAGHETTANALTWAWYLLSQHPDIEARWHAELTAVLGGRPPDLEDLPRLTYTRQIVAETLRLYPPAWAVGRRSLRTYQLGPYTVPPGSVLMMPQYVVHRDPRFYPQPERFDPERFTPEAEKSRPRFAYFPFGGGSRVCIGDSFAWMEATLVLAALGQRWTLSLAADQDVDIHPMMTLRPRYGMRMRVYARGG